ncbi:MAG: homogentisate 1,2-dioxygenase [Kofleriaceae bacterium]|jgi:homogentisate 1,2-dioxygenase|nr:homogentisate 1,2-dioxygenase [Kofleriaceae bacterium]MBP6838415.1 homogentisate 1,2-dioxygenase [Kofleriaceae bacterium]MBP9203439.1 homogentisate 1,2-dioxygenase [Kofleriaceae bacterium]
MHIPHVRGRVAAQAHVGLPDGTVEEEYARDGFFGRYAHLYREHAPVGWTRIEGPLRPRAYGLDAIGAGDYLAARVPLLTNADCKVLMAAVREPMPYYFRNADADTVLFVHVGAGRLETDFGHLAYEPGDYLVVPRGTVHRLAPSSETRLLVIETTGQVEVPDRGMLGQHALFDPAVLRVPTPGEGSALAADARGEWRLMIQRQGALTSVWYPHCPLDVVGWKGTLTVWQLNVRDIRPVSSDRYHLPPSAHTTFIAAGVAICTFAPRPLENGDPRALKVPFYHSNIDYDEVLFYHQGEFFSRAGISPGMLTFHPQGIHHGPQAGAMQRTPTAQRTEEIAVMVDTRRPLDVCAPAAAFERDDYWTSWQPKEP